MSSSGPPPKSGGGSFPPPPPPLLPLAGPREPPPIVDGVDGDEGDDARGPPPPPAPAPSPMPPRNCTDWAMMSVANFFCPVSLSSHERVRSLPSMYTLRPFARYWAQFSAVFPKTCTRCHSVCSCF